MPSPLQPSRPIHATLLYLSVIIATLGSGFTPNPGQSLSDLQALVKPEPSISMHLVPLSAVLSRLEHRSAWDEFMSAQSSDVAAYIDPRGATAANILGATPLIPGSGVGNQVTLTSVGELLGLQVTDVTPPVVAALVLNFVVDHQSILGVDPSELGSAYASKVTDGLWHISIPQEVDGIRVRHARIAANINHGNLVIIGAQRWGKVSISTHPTIDPIEAEDHAFQYVGGMQPQDVIWRQPALEILTYVSPERATPYSPSGPVGDGYAHRLVWVVGFERPPDPGRWETVVDASTGEIIAFQDITVDAKRHITGGVYPATSTEVCSAPEAYKCGQMQTGYPMPWADWKDGGLGSAQYTNGAGVFDATDTSATVLDGKYLTIQESTICVLPEALTSTGDLNLQGQNGDHTCKWNGTSPNAYTCSCSGDEGPVCCTGPHAEQSCTLNHDCWDRRASSPAARTAFYEVNKMFEIARGWLPNNAWARGDLGKVTVKVNKGSQACNASWDFDSNGLNLGMDSTISEPKCRNPGESASWIDHEWGHGLDDNDSIGAVSDPQEGYADIAYLYRQQASCFGYGFFYTQQSALCDMTSDATGYNGNENYGGSTLCLLECSGPRDADYYHHHADGLPATLTNYVCQRCSSDIHCYGAPVAQAAWDFATVDLQAAPFNYDASTAFLIANKIFFQGSGNIGKWYDPDCSAPSSGGCGAYSGYMQWLAADDDNGSVLDGTPHMTALFNAFHRHEIACSPNELADADAWTQYGSIFSGTYTNMWTSDSVFEVLKEGLVAGASLLSHVWRFDNLPRDLSRTLVVAGYRPNNSEGDNFQFAWSNDGVGFTDIPNALIKKITYPSGGNTYPFSGTYSPTVYIKVYDTQPTGPNIDTLYIDFLAIGGSTPISQNGGCVGGPTAAPGLTVAGGPLSDKTLTWNTVTGAAKYWVFRTEGYAGCDLGKALIAEVTGTSYVDSEVANNRQYFYTVMAVGANSHCFGPASTCQASPM